MNDDNTNKAGEGGEYASDYDFATDSVQEFAPLEAGTDATDDEPDWGDLPEFIDSPGAGDETPTETRVDASGLTSESPVFGESLAAAVELPAAPAAVIAVAEPEPAPAPQPTAKTMARRALAEKLPRESAKLDRLSDFKSPYAAAYLEVLDAQEAVETAKAQVIEAEARIGDGLVALLSRSEQLLERAQRIENSITLASDMLGQQAKLIAKAFREQLTSSEVDGIATLKTHLGEVADEVANKATVALNQVADEAAAFSGVKAEAAALQRVTGVVMEQAKQAGLEQTVLALANVIGRLQTAAERIEQAPAPAPAPQHQAEAQQWAPQGLGAHRMVAMWIGHHLGTPGILIALAGVGALGWHFFG